MLIKVINGGRHRLLSFDEGRVHGEPTNQLVLEAPSVLDSEVEVAPELELLIYFDGHFLNHCLFARTRLNMSLILIVDVVSFEVE